MALYDLDGVGPELRGRGPAFLAHDAKVIGKVTLGEDSGIWFGCVLRGDNERITIGARTNVQEHCIMHTDMGFPLVVGDGCTIGHRAMLHGCTVGNNSLIGIGAIVLNGAKIGRNCLVGAGALVTEGKEFPDGSLIIGSPARVARTLDDKAIAMLRESADHYVENARRFSSGLNRV
ncbi:gamma carbonic anhydrase family protein [Oricola thermophila]|uniref:Gamma carbonic anhydrase family protein n=1 Tax=Oricola thermophila TaxID=2742145 RepID=A0A6N1VBY9_9HYPH|nr:gamma carbonic anhydrase family protein [Oricola thermophila]QKV18073.1 gamma carbonic anhydrase family protein [Oricola thermophila]